MKFDIKYSKIGNFFFFISNLSDWHFSCRKEYNEAWIKQTGELSNNEKNAIENFRKIMTKYGFITKEKNSTPRYYLLLSVFPHRFREETVTYTNI